MRVKVLAMCHANRFRSPLLAAFLAQHSYLDVRSAGFLESGRPAGKPVRDAAAKLGYDLSEHRSTQVSNKLMSWADYALTMNPTQQAKLCTSYSLYKNCTITCLGYYLNPKVESIPDLGFINPRDDRFDEVVSMIQRAAAGFAECLRPKEDTGSKKSSSSASS